MPFVNYRCCWSALRALTLMRIVKDSGIRAKCKIVIVRVSASLEKPGGESRAAVASGMTL
jgi:hypothetical protein